MTPIIFNVVVIEELHHGCGSHTHCNVIPGVVHDLRPSDSHEGITDWLPKQFFSGFRLVIALIAEDHSMQLGNHAALVGS